MKYIMNSFRQVAKYEDVQDTITMIGLISIFGLAIVASAVPLF
jgi:hypothetical protein